MSRIRTVVFADLDDTLINLSRYMYGEELIFHPELIKLIVNAATNIEVCIVTSQSPGLIVKRCSEIGKKKPLDDKQLPTPEKVIKDTYAPFAAGNLRVHLERLSGKVIPVSVCMRSDLRVSGSESGFSLGSTAKETPETPEETSLNFRQWKFETNTSFIQDTKENKKLQIALALKHYTDRLGSDELLRVLWFDNEPDNVDNTYLSTYEGIRSEQTAPPSGDDIAKARNRFWSNFAVGIDHHKIHQFAAFHLPTNFNISLGISATLTCYNAENEDKPGKRISLMMRSDGKTISFDLRRFNDIDTFFAKIQRSLRPVTLGTNSSAAAAESTANESTATTRSESSLFQQRNSQNSANHQVSVFLANVASAIAKYEALKKSKAAGLFSKYRERSAESEKFVTEVNTILQQPEHASKYRDILEAIKNTKNSGDLHDLLVTLKLKVSQSFFSRLFS